MDNFYTDITATDLSASRSKDEIMHELVQKAGEQGFMVVDSDMQKPWGGFVRFDTKDASRFITAFFPGLDTGEARLGQNDMELSPKFLLVSPNSRLSWQRHARRAECWAYIMSGGYHKSINPDDQGELQLAKVGDVVQLQQGECHRLVGLPGESYTLVAEIWQHTNPNTPSDEGDIERLADDYKR